MFCLQAEDGIRELVRSRGLGDVYKRQLREKQNELADLTAAGELAKSWTSIQTQVERAKESLSLIHI